MFWVRGKMYRLIAAGALCAALMIAVVAASEL
jgi:hypothetical protein